MMIAHTCNSIDYYTFETWPNLTHAIFTRNGGVSQPPFDSLNVGSTVGDDQEAVQVNHKRMYEVFNLNRERARTVWMIHGHDVVVINDDVVGRKWVTKADAMVTNEPDIPLVMRYADCTPIMLYDPCKQVIGIAHAGWRGTVAGIASNTIKTMKATYGCNPADIQAGIGPAIGPGCYQVGEEVVQATLNYFGTLDGLINRDPVDGTTYLNLWEANRRDLENIGIRQIEISAICTASNLDQFYSHRAEKGRTGRFGAVIAL